MLLIIEGIDCVGKSTFVGKLQKTLPNAVVLRAGAPKPPDRDPFEEYEQTLYEHLDSDRPIICDRWHWGERTYGPLLRGHERLGDAGWRHIELFLAAQGAVVVYLHQPRTVVEDCLERRGDDLIRPDHLIHLEVGYQWCVRNTILPTIAFREQRETDAWHVVGLASSYARPHYFESYVGRTFPDVLLFGERRGGTPPHADRAAFVPRRKTSGYYLLHYLPERMWPSVGIANALEEDPETVWWSLDRPPVVALGAEAKRALEKTKIPHAAVPHPQFVRRFHHSQLPEYGRLIERVTGTTEDHLDWRGDSETKG